MKNLEEITALTPWVPAWHETGACADRRHILWIYEILKRTGVKRTLEIGVHSGCSSAAFVAAGVPDAHFCDITRRADAMSVIRGHGTFHQRKGCDVIHDSEPFDLVFVDGRHDMEAVMEEWEALKAKPPKIIIAHDVNSTTIGFPHCEGAAWLQGVLSVGGSIHLEDKQLREGEMTHRGMLAATYSTDLSSRILAAYDAIL
jgi:hypothetical protein